MATIDLMDQFSHLGEGGIRNNGTLDAEVMFQPSLRTMRTDFIQVKAGDSIVYKNMSGMSSIWNILSFYTGDAQGYYVSGIAGQTTPQSGVWTAQQNGYVRLFGSFPAGDNISVTMTDLAPDVEDYLSQYNAMNYRFLPNSIPKIVAHIQEYLTDHPIADSTTLQAVIDAAFRSYLEEIQETADTYISEAVPPSAAAAVDAAAAPALAEITAKTAEAAESARQAGLSQQSAEMSEENALTYRNQAQQIKDSISAEVASSVLAAQEQATLAQESAQAADESADNAAQSAATFSTDPTLTIAGKAADAKATGDELSALKSAVSEMCYGKSKPELIPNKYWNYNGDLVSYNGWSATKPISCGSASKLYIYSTVKSAFNLWFDDAAGGSEHKVGGFTVDVGDNIIDVREGATFFALSNTTEGMNGTIITILPTYDDYMALKSDVAANSAEIESIEQEGAAEKSSVLFLNPRSSVGQNIVAATKKLNPWTISPNPTVQDVVTFGIITDLHGSKTELERYLQFCADYGTYINGGLLSLGDMVTNVYANDYNFWLNTTGSDEIMLTIGNHDVWLTNSVSAELAPKADAYAKYFAPNVSKWGVTQPTNAASQGLMYYYKDYAENKLRLIVLDCMYWDSTENTWFINALSGARTNNYDVLAIEHYNPSKTLTPMQGNFNSLDYGFSHLVPGNASAQMVAAVEQFISDGGSFVGWLSGDAHYDAFGVYEHNSIKQASFTFEAGGHSAGWGDAARVVGQKSQDSFNIVAVDTYSKLVKIVRVGNDCDRYLRSKQYLTYNYSTHEVVTTM